MNWGLKKIRTIPSAEIEDFLTHAIERNNLGEALESCETLKNKYGFTEELNKKEQNENFNIKLKLESLNILNINAETLIKEY